MYVCARGCDLNCGTHQTSKLQQYTPEYHYLVRLVRMEREHCAIPYSRVNRIRLQTYCVHDRATVCCCSDHQYYNLDTHKSRSI